MFWYVWWGLGPWWWLVPVLMCVGMVAMMLLMRGGRMAGMGWCGGGHAGDAPADPALDTLRRRFASGELTPQEYEEQRKLLLVG